MNRDIYYAKYYGRGGGGGEWSLGEKTEKFSCRGKNEKGLKIKTALFWVINSKIFRKLKKKEKKKVKQGVETDTASKI